MWGASSRASSRFASSSACSSTSSGTAEGFGKSKRRRPMRRATRPGGRARPGCASRSSARRGSRCAPEPSPRVADGRSRRSRPGRRAPHPEATVPMCMIEVGPAHCASRTDRARGADLALVADLPAGLRVEGVRPRKTSTSSPSCATSSRRAPSRGAQGDRPSASGWRWPTNSDGGTAPASMPTSTFFTAARALAAAPRAAPEPGLVDGEPRPGGELAGQLDREPERVESLNASAPTMRRLRRAPSPRRTASCPGGGWR